MLSFLLPSDPPFLLPTCLQPSLDIFEAFDELLLLKQGGVCVYFGPLGWESANLIAYFSPIRGVQPIMPG
jgi:hypothetical protein